VQVGFGIDTAALTAAPLLGMPVWPLYFTRAIGGASSGFYTAGYAYVADISTLSNRSKSFGVFGVAMGLAFLFGPIVAGLLGQVRASHLHHRGIRHCIQCVMTLP
jgi:MFS family permease